MLHGLLPILEVPKSLHALELWFLMPIFRCVLGNRAPQDAGLLCEVAR